MKHRDCGRLAESSQNDWACTRILNIGKCGCFTLPQWLNEIDNMLDQILGLFEKMLPLICSDLSLCFPFKPLIFEGVTCVIHSCTCHAFGIAKKGWNEQRSEPRQSQKAVRFVAARARQTHSVAGWFQICYMWVKHGKTIINHWEWCIPPNYLWWFGGWFIVSPTLCVQPLVFFSRKIGCWFQASNIQQVMGAEKYATSRYHTRHERFPAEKGQPSGYRPCRPFEAKAAALVEAKTGWKAKTLGVEAQELLAEEVEGVEAAERESRSRKSCGSEGWVGGGLLLGRGVGWRPNLWETCIWHAQLLLGSLGLPMPRVSVPADLMWPGWLEANVVDIITQYTLMCVPFLRGKFWPTTLHLKDS